MAVFRSKAFKASFDPAFDDLDLADARDELAQGRWEPARDLLEDTRRDWDRRTHRIKVLADTTAASAWLERWLALDPRNPDAATLQAHVEVVRQVRAQVRENGTSKTAADVEALCRRAAALSPQDPMPWISLVTLARAQGVDREELWARWRGMRERDPWNREGHHQALIYLFAAWHGSHAEMYDFAYWLAGEAPEGSPLAVLPLVAHAESYRAHSAEKRAAVRAGLDMMWTEDQVGLDLDRILERWFRRQQRQHAQAKADLNYLAHALIHADRHADARPVMQAIGPHVTRVPWAYTGDPEPSFLYWRQRLLGG
ncbi:hypothetical protein KGA66_07415 [Actinocrinis puniceicyclus]|uniref:DUF4034 domain-containing protein n=1 Tax=Actinocrinis puniceicyclus TaxID=977794 RepID=A0A8J7WNV1_9ACTN|nr:hypothetical protein [Actinocrinis puniceicyclus]MBS2962865.1 hypothetical protein [Actinocrinis puniceicyclus]